MDLFHAESANGGSLVCLATSISATTISSRTITHQLIVEFDPESGQAREDVNEAGINIDSVAPLPDDIHDILVHYDQTTRAGRDPKLSKDEIKAFLFVDDFYKSHPI